jgi:hypothetical protein
MSRVHIGEKNGRMGAWISAAGSDASSEQGRMLLDSDADNLRPFYFTSFKSEAPTSEGGYWDHGPFIVPVPNAPTTYIPLVFVGIAYDTSLFNLPFPMLAENSDTFVIDEDAGYYFGRDNDGEIDINYFRSPSAHLWLFVSVFANPVVIEPKVQI